MARRIESNQGNDYRKHQIVSGGAIGEAGNFEYRGK
jgi:hypothetical protein